MYKFPRELGFQEQPDRETYYTILLMLKLGLLIANEIREFCNSCDKKNNGYVFEFTEC